MVVVQFGNDERGDDGRQRAVVLPVAKAAAAQRQRLAAAVKKRPVAVNKRPAAKSHRTVLTLQRPPLPLSAKRMRV